MLVVYSLAGISALSHVVPMYRLVAGTVCCLVTRRCQPRRENRRKPTIWSRTGPLQGHSGRGGRTPRYQGPPILEVFDSGGKKGL
jgi:hypothetical protein